MQRKAASHMPHPDGTFLASSEGLSHGFPSWAVRPSVLRSQRARASRTRESTQFLSAVARRLDFKRHSSAATLLLFDSCSLLHTVTLHSSPAETPDKFSCYGRRRGGERRRRGMEEVSGCLEASAAFECEDDIVLLSLLRRPLCIATSSMSLPTPLLAAGISCD